MQEIDGPVSCHPSSGATRPYWGLTTLEGADVEFPPLSSKECTEFACRRWRVAQYPLKGDYWDRTLQEEGFPPKFRTWLHRTITEGGIWAVGEKREIMQRRKGAERRRGETSLQTSTKKSYPYIELSVQANIDLGDRCSRNSLSLQRIPYQRKG